MTKHAKIALDTLTGLYAVATGQITHVNMGSCPDSLEGANVRDDDCPACQVLLAVDDELSEVGAALPGMPAAHKKTKDEQFLADMIRCRGIEFARLGMMVEVNGEMGTIQGTNGSANLDVLYTNQLKHGEDLHNCHPTWNVKYFDQDGKVIAHFDDCKCVFRPEREAA